MAGSFAMRCLEVVVERGILNHMWVEDAARSWLSQLKSNKKENLHGSCFDLTMTLPSAAVTSNW